MHFKFYVIVIYGAWGKHKTTLQDFISKKSIHYLQWIVIFLNHQPELSDNKFLQHIMISTSTHRLHQTIEYSLITSRKWLKKKFVRVILYDWNVLLNHPTRNYCKLCSSVREYLDREWSLQYVQSSKLVGVRASVQLHFMEQGLGSLLYLCLAASGDPENSSLKTTGRKY